jgi:hypothetical protein
LLVRFLFIAESGGQLARLGRELKAVDAREKARQKQEWCRRHRSHELLPSDPACGKVGNQEETGKDL